MTPISPSQATKLASLFDPTLLPVLLAQVVALAQHSSAIAMQHFSCNGVASSAKADNSPITVADLQVHHYLATTLAKLLPGVPVLSEEDTPNAHPQRLGYGVLWLLDPLDGTLEFSQGIAEFTINIALVVAGEVKLSVIAVPAQGCIYASCGAGVYVIAQGQWQLCKQAPAYNPSQGLRVAVSRRTTPAEQADYARMLGLGHIDAIQWVQAGSAYKFILLLRGEVDVYPRLQPCYEWDTAAGQGLLQANGGGLWAYNQEGLAMPFAYNQRHSLLNGAFVALGHASLRQLCIV